MSKKLKVVLNIIFFISILLATGCSRSSESKKKDPFYGLVSKIQTNLDTIPDLTSSNDSRSIIPFSDKYGDVKVEVVRFVKLDFGDDGYKYLGGLNKIVIHKDIIYVLDKSTHTLFWFTIDGGYINSLSNIGKGPAEYIKLNDFSIDEENKRIILMANSGRKVLFYTLSGDFLREFQTPVWAYNFTAAHSNLLCFLTLGNNFSGYKTILTDSTGQPVGKAVATSDKYKINMYPFTSLISGSKNSTIFSFPFSSDIYEIRGDSISLRYKLELGNHRFSHEKYDNFKAYASAFNESSGFISLGDVFETKSLIGFSLSEPNYKISTLIYSKELEESRLCNPSLLPNKATIPFPHLTFENTLVSAIPSQLLLDFKEEISTKYDTEDLYENLSVSSNDVLLFYKLKTSW